jgi:ribonuclease HI
MDKTKPSNFVVSISEEKKRIKDLKFNLFIKGNSFNHKGSWCSIIQTSKNEKFTLNGESSNTNTDRMELFALNEGIKKILLTVDEKDYKHVKIIVYTESVYCTNVMKEWIQIWKKERFINRPNIDLLQQISLYLEKCNITLQYVSLKNCNASSILFEIVNELESNLKTNLN